MSKVANPNTHKEGETKSRSWYILVAIYINGVHPKRNVDATFIRKLICTNNLVHSDWNVSRESIMFEQGSFQFHFRRKGSIYSNESGSHHYTLANDAAIRSGCSKTVEVLGSAAAFTGQRATMNYIITAWEQVIDYILAINVNYFNCCGLGCTYRHAHKHQASDHELKKADKIRGSHEELEDSMIRMDWF